MKKPTRQILPSALVLAVALVSGGWFLQQGVERGQNVYVQVRLLNEVVDHVVERYVDEVDRSSLYRSAIEGLLDDLGDPNTAFLDAEDYENLRIQTEGEYGGVGLEIVEREGWITVVSPLPGTPAMRAGIRAGDRIVEVEGQSTEDWSTQQAVDVLRGDAGSEVSVRIQRPGVDALIPFTLTRARVTVRSVPFATMLTERVGYVPLNLVSESSTREVREAVDSLRGEGMEGLVLDLRGNPGGLLDQGVALSDLFLDADQPVVETRGRAAGQDETFRSRTRQAFTDMPVVVLVDERSASASEILAGALQDHDRALIVGNTTFGKGSVQTLYRLSGGGVLKLTTAHWFTPVGRSIQKPQEEQMAAMEQGVPTLDGSLTALPDTAERPTFVTEGGRTVLGGGGITPDVVILPDTLSSQEQRAVRALYRHAGSFFLGLFNFSVRYLQEHPEMGPSPEVTDAVLEQFRAHLLEQDVPVDAEIYREARRFVAYQLGKELALQKGGDQAEFRYASAWDRQLQAATELLEEAGTPQALFRTAAGGAGPE
ncbi:MAG TPA: S41 family peptidase [Longimicrobiales bacterium]|nr:S41 family peptidase [Longimicrobiales bacterium]